MLECMSAVIFSFRRCLLTPQQIIALYSCDFTYFDYLQWQIRYSFEHTINVRRRQSTYSSEDFSIHVLVIVCTSCVVVWGGCSSIDGGPYMRILGITILGSSGASPCSGGASTCSGSASTCSGGASTCSVGLLRLYSIVE